MIKMQVYTIPLCYNRLYYINGVTSFGLGEQKHIFEKIHILIKYGGWDKSMSNYENVRCLMSL